ncbi:hypothetical protein ILYODFUR_036286, partial [Ilyodon furcidens]
MVKCVVSGCPNRVEGSNRGTFNRTQKRFFKFPGDPARVKVWLAALRQTDQKDSSDQNLICEDHFLPEDISSNEVSADAIPIMPPCLDGPLGMMDPWGAGSEEEEEDQWAAGADEEYEDEELINRTLYPPTGFGSQSGSGRLNSQHQPTSAGTDGSSQDPDQR